MDARIAVHMHHALQQEMKKNTGGSFSGHKCHCYQKVNFLHMYRFAFGTGKNCRYLTVNATCDSLGEPKSRALPVFCH